MINVLVVDNHTLVRQGIIRLLAVDDSINIVGEASNGFDALGKARDLKPDVVLTDIYMPGLDGLSLTGLLKNEMPEVQVVIVSASLTEEDIVEGVRSGARGFIPKNTDAANMIKQVKQAAAGGVALTEDVTAKPVTALAQKVERRNSGNSILYAPLSEREKDVLEFMAQGKSNKYTADALVVSVNTIRAHVRSLMQKLNVENRTQLAIYGLREGFGLHRAKPVVNSQSRSAAQAP
ncbi:MAG: response regulator transcription factor [SAR202 cluster bacterium]|nr:response regulator transcription factor [SAR202 cluster bacterium]